MRQGAGNVWVDLGYVLLQTVVVGVALITEVAGERFCSGVSQEMSLHVVELLEPPLTDGAAEWFVIRVNFHVSLQSYLFSEPFVTKIALHVTSRVHQHFCLRLSVLRELGCRGLCSL